jgi:signal transduction histidine kinase
MEATPETTRIEETKETTNAAVALRAIGCHRCDAEAGVRIGREFLCGSCAVQDLGSDLEPPVVLCDVCERESTLRFDERFLCGRCALAMLCLDADPEPDVVGRFGSALTSAIVGHREPAIDIAWQIAKRTRDARLSIADASAMYHRALVEAIGADEVPPRTVRWLQAASGVFGTYAAAMDGYVGTLVDEVRVLRAQVAAAESVGDDLRRDQEETTIRLRRAETERGSLIRHLTRAKEEERGRIAEEIHDDTVQTLVAVQMRLQALGARATDETSSEMLAELGRLTAGSIGRLRTLMFELRSDLLDRYGLAGVLKELLRRTEEQFGIGFRVEDRLQFEPEAEVRANVYRVAQEAITNVRKHAGASMIRVALDAHDGGVMLTVGDDGGGFDPSATPPCEHAGLRFMRDRADRAGGWFEVASVDGVGTTVTAWIPNSIGPDR